MARILFVTGSDSSQFQLASDCIDSIQEHASHLEYDIAFLDLGCTGSELRHVASKQCLVREPKWEFGIQNTIPQLECRRGQISRPFFPTHFPNHEMFFWIDADAWIQDRSAIDLFVQAAVTSGAALVPEIERSSKFYNGGLVTYLGGLANLYRQIYGDDPVSKLFQYTQLNAGVFCFHRDSHVWGVWKESLRYAVQRFFQKPRTPGDIVAAFGLIDQMALNVGIRQHGLETAIQFLPLTCNWTCHLSLPAYDERRSLLVEPYLPHAPVGILHLTNPWGGPLNAIPHSHERRTRLEQLVEPRKEFYESCRLQTTDGGSVVGSLMRKGKGRLRRAVAPHELTQGWEASRAPSLSKYDYVAPGLQVIWPDGSFPYMIEGNPDDCAWPFLRRNSPHRWYVDRRCPAIGFVSRDEAAILHSSALLMAGARALEIGCWQGWSACHLAAARIRLDVVDPILADERFRSTIEQSLRSFGVASHIELHPDESPRAIDRIAAKAGDKWGLFFIDGDHEGDAVERDTLACLPHAAADCMLLYHDLLSPDVARVLPLLKHNGWDVMLYLTSQVMAIAWRGNVEPIQHTPDPAIAAMPIPRHLVGFPISGL
jgi:hypothetical protein